MKSLKQMFFDISKKEPEIKLMEALDSASPPMCNRFQNTLEHNLKIFI